MAQWWSRVGLAERVSWAAFSCAALVLGLASASPTLAHGLANSVAFTDERGDAVAFTPGVTADRPDITRVVVSNDADGLVTFRISLLEQPVLRDDMRFHILIDADRDRTTGIPGGYEDILRWESRCGGLCNPFPSSSFHYEPNVAVLTFSGRPEANPGRGDALNTRWFRFAVAVETGVLYDPTTGKLDFANSSWDVAPSQAGPFCAVSPNPLHPTCPLWDYGVRYGPARLVAKQLTVSPARPVAGRRLTVGLAVARSDTGEPAVRGRVLCQASVATVALRPNLERFVRGRPTCGFVVPTGARGRRLVGSITAVADGLVLKRTFARQIS